MLNGITLMKAATGITVTGGAATVFSEDSVEVAGGIHIIDESVTDLTVTPHATFKSVTHKMQSDGTFSKAKRNVNYTLPMVLADGPISYMVFRGSFEFHPEATVAQIKELRLMAIQLIMDSEVDNFYNKGSRA